MARYTMELHDVLKTHNIFNFPYEIHESVRKSDFEEMFKRHFYFREIGVETPEMFIHFLRDKMTLVFPYYNELLRTATIEYDVENPYNLTETYKRKRDNLGKTAGFFSGVGMENVTQESDTTENGTEHSSDSRNAITDDNRISDHSETVTDDGSTKTTRSAENSSSVGETGNNVKKYLDTPQELSDISNSKYLTNITRDDTSKNVESEASEKVTENGESDNKRVSEGSENATGKTTVSDSAEGNKERENSIKNNATSERKNTNDSNTRSETIGKEVEEYTIERKGNIGVNPASYEIDMHIKTQQVLKRIFEMFFAECEDLFMQVF